MSDCVACGARAPRAFPAVVAPFVAERVGAAPVACRLLECTVCGHRAFDLALDDAQVGRLYAGYRGEAYLRVRHRWEPWYTRRVNEAIGGGPAELAGRRTALEDWLGPRLPPEARGGALLDYGGDRGQFIPPGIGGERYLYDVSGIEPVEGVRSLRDPAALGGIPFRIVLLAHVLEHVSDPLRFLRDMRTTLGPPSSRHWLYVEVPLERPRILKRALPPGAPAGRSVPLVVRSRLPWIAIDFLSTVARVKLGVVPPLGVIKLHEHVSFFTERSLRMLLERAGYEVTDAACVSLPLSSGLTKVIRALGRARSG